MRAYDVPGVLNPHAKRNVQIVALVPDNLDENISGEAIMTALGGKELAFFAISTRSSELAIRLGTYFETYEWRTTTIGVRSTLVPPRMPLCVASLRSIVTIDHAESARRMRELWRFVELRPGPTSGLAFGGLLKFLEKWLVSVDTSINTSTHGCDERRYGSTAAFLCSDLLARRLK